MARFKSLLSRELSSVKRGRPSTADRQPERHTHSDSGQAPYQTTEGNRQADTQLYTFGLLDQAIEN